MKVIGNLLMAYVFFLAVVPQGACAQVGKPLIRFGLFADAQYADHDAQGNRYYRNSLEKIRESVEFFNSREVRFAVNLGDLTDRSFSDSDTILSCLKGLKAKIYHVTGNHDYKEVKDNRILFQKLGMPAGYYSFRKKNWVFIFMDSNEVASYSNVEGTEKEKEFQAIKARIEAGGGVQGASWNGGVSARQLEWLNRLLEKSEKAGRQVIIFSHHPFYPRTPFSALNDEQVMEVIRPYSCVKAIFSGHHHAGGFAFFNRIPVVTVEGMIETKDKNAYGLVEIYSDRIVVEGQGRMTSRVFEL